MAMAKRMRSLASVLWDTDLEASDQEGYQIQEVDAVQKTRRLEKENADLLAEVTHLRQENTLLKIPKPMPTEPSQLCRTRPELLRTWPLQRWVASLGEDVLRLPRLWQEILPQLHDSNNCSERILFDLCKSPKATASTILSHAERTVENLFKKHPAVFKVGISSNPVKRWSHPLYGYALDKRECWLGMKILAACETSFGAALVESSLIRIFQNSPGCRNDRPGGETPSPDEGPHFTYVVYRILLPPQKVVSPAIRKASNLPTLSVITLLALSLDHVAIVCPK